MENSIILLRIQIERFISVEIFRIKGNTFRGIKGITFFPPFPKRPKFSAPFVPIFRAMLPIERRWRIFRYFVNGLSQSHSCFLCEKQYQYHLSEIFFEISVQMVALSM